MELALGTVQFGVGYGVAGRDEPIPEAEVRSILAHALELGIDVLDTAEAYGDIQRRLKHLAPQGAFRIVTKLSAVPQGLNAAQASDWVDQALERARADLGDMLYAVMFHRAEDLLDAVWGAALWERSLRWAERAGCKLGVSCYDPATLNMVRDRYPVVIAQLPGNAFDQRLITAPVRDAEAVEVHVRSAFLQGLLLMPEQVAAQRIPQAAQPLRRWHEWLRGHSLTPLSAALGIVKDLPGASHCVVGVDGLAQLEEITTAWATAPKLRDEALAVKDLHVIDPRYWPRNT